MEIINLTPHEINVFTEAGTITFPASGNVARVSTKRETVQQIDGIPVNHTTFGEVVGLPEQKEGTFYIVSLATAKAVNRSDLLVTDEAVRDDDGKIIGCKAFAVV